MSTTEKTISALVERQLPDFVRADHPQFKRFLELYYTWLEDEAAGNTIYHIMHSGEYRDVDETLDPFIRLFKMELLPYFPEKSAADLVKILKGAREFYAKKGSVESVKWLFRVLFGQDVEVYYPKQQILIASDGKWKLPQAFQLTLSPENQGVDVNLLEKHKAIGSISKATCIIESANRTVDRTFGSEILEMYVSNVFKEFENGENLEITYTDEWGDEQVFIEKIIGSISNIFVDSNIRTDPQQKRRGLLYNVGDPVVVFGGLSDTGDANDAVAIVGNVSVGSIEGLGVTFPGYGYRIYSNTEVVVYRSPGDDPNANTSADIRVIAINSSNSFSNSQARFLEPITVDMTPIEYMANTLLSNTTYPELSGNNRNIVVTVNNDGDPWIQHERVYANSNGSYETANFTAQIATSNIGWTGASGDILLFNVSNTEILTTPGFLIGTDILLTTESGALLNVTAVVANSIPANLNSQIGTVLSNQTFDTGGIALYNIINGGYGFRSTPVVDTTSYYDTFWSGLYGYGSANQRAYRQPVVAFGKIAHVYINNGGDGYQNGDLISVIGRGYDFSGYVTVDGNGSIVSTTITNRGEGYTGPKTVSVASANGANASLTAYGYGEGVTIGVETGAIGRVKDVRMISRGRGYVDTPLVSFKVVDMVIDGIDESENLPEGERVFQGVTLQTATFQGIIKDYNRSTKMLRLFDYSGNSFSNFNSTLTFESEGGVRFNVNPSANVTAPNEYPNYIKATGLPNPWFYGNGKAKGYAEFFNGLIKFNGFYLNTDGFLSADKKLQDDKMYHNYSYVIQSEKNRAEYLNSMLDILHPSGMILLSRLVTNSEIRAGRPAPGGEGGASGGQGVFVGSGVCQIPDIDSNTNTVFEVVNVLNTYSTIVTGSNTTFLRFSSGDMFILIDTISPLRSQAKTIQSVASNTELEVTSNFIYMGQGRITTDANSDTVMVSGNTNPLSDFIRITDRIRMNVNNQSLVFSVWGISGNTLSLNTTVSTSNTNVPYEVIPDYTEQAELELRYPYKVIPICGGDYDPDWVPADVLPGDGS